ncbi:nitrile hydratase [Nocardia farcinica]|uniref:nitrile hydratase n=1 Tax=Nocardia farcinica TaxID=37329 RepID=UPI0018953663|nr:nitrile hydratase [Nocardia farcinica]MBF6358534.1 nitrile hydratase [Nocardia farcinica]MBF6383615.1 nitrile hydratase [Nocardia farcinica]MBF6417817.1 nitrile hydratase [Nocardia farcinica]MBF6429294.1 nitrile hydratase [Nocardia farcinica]MBF6499878.1 nitrile hydratase [Nocardia farcinica]
MSEDLERALTERAWRDLAFADELRTDPAAALARLGVEVPPGLRIDVRVQRRDTLYYVVPPAADDGGSGDEIVNQMDLWRSGDQFCWILPQHAKVALLAMRQAHRRWAGEQEGNAS